MRRWIVALLLLAAPRLEGQPAPEAAQAQELSQQCVAAILAGDSGELVEAKLLEALRLYAQIEELQGQAECHQLLGTVYGRRETYTEARAHLHASAALWRRLGARLGEWQALYGLAESSHYSGFQAEALAVLERAGEVLGELADPAVPLDLESLRLAARGQGMSAEGLLQLQAQLPILRRLLLDQFTGLTLLKRATVLRDLARYDEASSSLEQARPLARAPGFLEAKILVGMGEIHMARAEDTAAMQLFEQAKQRAHQLFEQLKPILEAQGQPPAAAAEIRVDEALALKNIALLEQRAGRYEEALAHQRQALALAREIGNLQLCATLMVRRGDVFLAQGRFEQAKASLEEALETARASRARDAEATSLGLLAAYHTIAGRYEEALRYQDEALGIFHKMGYRGQEAELLMLTSSTYIQLGKYREALERIEQASEIEHEIGAETASALGALRKATIYFHLGEVEKAGAEAQKSLELARRLESLLEEVDALVALGWIHQRRGEWKSALAAVERARALARKGGYHGGEISADLAAGFVSFEAKNDTAAAAAFSRVLAAARAMGHESVELTASMALAAAQHRRGEKAAAIETLEQAAAKLDVHLGRLHVDEFAAAFSSLEPNGVHAVLAQRYAEQGEIATAFLHAERARARTFLDQLGRPWQALETDGTDERSQKVRSLAEEIVQLEGTLDQTRSVDVKKWHAASTAALRETLAGKREQYRQALTELELHRPETAALVGVDASTLEQVAASLDPETTLLAYFGLENEVLVWVVDRESSTLANLPIRRKNLAQDVETFSDGIASRDFDRLLAARLYEELVAPLRAELRHRRLVIVPHGALHELPFAALWNAREGRYFIEEHALAFVPSASVLRFLEAKRSSNEGKVLVLANPDGSLSGAEEEARAIAFLYDTEAHLGAQASEARLRAAAGGADLLHLAAHGRFDDQQPQFSRLELAPGAGHDGRLEVHEIFGGLDLRGVNLAVLSACQSGRGERTRGDDLLGLTRAFLYAGSPAVLSTPWSIDDNASRFLIEAFYGRLRAGDDAAEALRRAQLATLARLEFSSPFYWAAFALHGDWKTVETSP